MSYQLVDTEHKINLQKKLPKSAKAQLSSQFSSQFSSVLKDNVEAHAKLREAAMRK